MLDGILPHSTTDTILVLTKTELHALAGSKKTDLLGPLAPAAEAAGVKLVLHTKPRKEDGAAQMQSLLDALKGSGEVGTVTVGTLPKVSAGLAGGGAPPAVLML